MTDSKFDTQVIIVGAGPVGLYAAYRLAQAGISSIVFEKDDSLSQLPRAGIYYPPVQFAFVKDGLWDALIKGGAFRTTGLDMRNGPVSDGQGGKKMGSLIACYPKEENLDIYGLPTASRAISMLNLAQPKLADVLLEMAVSTGKVEVRFNNELVTIDDNGGESEVVVVSVKDTVSRETRQFRSAFLIGSDGARSKVRSQLNIPFQGHSWDEKVIATDVWLLNHDEMPITTTQILDPVHFAIITPLMPPVPGKHTKWRVTFASNPEEVATKGLDYHLQEEWISKMYDRVLGGPRPIEYKIDRVSPYTMHQRLASTLKRGRCLLAGDSAHVNTIIGGMGLSNCCLGAVALSDCLIMILNEGKPAEPMMKLYSDERRQAFQFLIDPVTSWNKLRLQANEPDDWLFSCVQDVYSPSYSRFLDLLQEYWPTKLRETAKDL